MYERSFERYHGNAHIIILRDVHTVALPYFGIIVPDTPYTPLHVMSGNFIESYDYLNNQRTEDF